jgi:hypothetical protein
MPEFKFSTRLTMGAGEGLLDIPHPIILKHMKPEELVGKKEEIKGVFDQTWGGKPKGVILPATAPDGLLYKIDELGLKPSDFFNILDDPKPKNIIDFAVDFAKLGCDIYLSIDPSLGFVQTDALHIRSIIGDQGAHVCIGNPRSRELMAFIVGIGSLKIIEALAKNKTPGKFAGIVVDACNLWPMGSNDAGRLSLNCFCESCTEYFRGKTEENDMSGLVQRFRTFPNPWNLVLDGSGRGIGYIDNLPDDISPEEIVGLSKQKGFDKLFQSQDEVSLLPLARDLKTYIRTRHDQTVEALSDFFEQVLTGMSMSKDDLQRIIITEGVYYDWSSGLQLDRLDENPKDSPFSEIWFNATSSDMMLKKMPFRSYMWRRSRYFIDAFFDLVASAADPMKRNATGVGLMSEDDLKDLLQKRLNSALAAQGDTGQIALSTLPDLQKPGTLGEKSQRIGFVGVALTNKIGQQLLGKLKIAPGQLESMTKMINPAMLSALKEMLGQQGGQ